jgi:Domain of unknown function (DUF6134)
MLKVFKNKVLRRMGTLGIIFAAALSTPAIADPGIDPIVLYGDKLEFSVFRNGSKVGKHEVTFKEVNDEVVANTIFDVNISFLNIPVYDYRYMSTGLWEKGKLRSINVNVDDDGEISSFAGFKLPAAFLINGKTEKLSADKEVYPTNHWNNGVLNQTEVLNTITGKMNKVTITKTGLEEVAVKNGTVKANRYVYTGELELESWYDLSGRWVKLKFKAKDNSEMEYFCETCLTQGMASNDG